MILGLSNRDKTGDRLLDIDPPEIAGSNTYWKGFDGPTPAKLEGFLNF